MTVLQNVFTRLSNISHITNYRYTYVNRISTSVLQFVPKLSVEEKLGIRPRPKRPNTPFLRFIVQNRSNVAQQNPEAKPKDVMKMLAEEWKKVDESVKVQMQEDYRKEWLQYVQDSKEYDKLLSPIDKEEIAKAKLEAKSDKEKKALKKKKEELGCPKKPCSSYVYFMKSKLPERGDKPYSEFQKQVIKEWEQMPELQKDRFEKLYQKDLEEYRQKMALWTKKMSEEGHVFDQKNEKAAAPKRPGSSFVYFMKSKLSERGEIPFKEFQKQIKDEWGKLPAEEKKKFEEMYKNDLEEYKMKMLEWNKHKQIKPGKSATTDSLVSPIVLVNVPPIQTSEDLKKTGVEGTTHQPIVEVAEDLPNNKLPKDKLCNEHTKEQLNKVFVEDFDKNSSSDKIRKSADELKSKKELENSNFNTKKVVYVSVVVTSVFIFGFFIYIFVFY